MKVSIAAFPKCWIENIVAGSMPLFDWIDQSTELECDGLELYAGFLTSHETAYLREVRRRIEGHGMTMPMLCYSPDFTVGDEQLRRREVANQIAAIRVTAELGGRFCRTLSGQNRPGMGRDQGIELVARCIEECLPEAEAHGVVLVLENHFKDTFWEHREFAQRMEVFVPLVARLDSPFLGVQFDPSNALVAGDDPLQLLDAVLPRVRTVHASDRYLVPGTTIEELRQHDGTLGYPEALVHGVTGAGTNDYPAIFSRLRDADFDGWISIEDGMDGMQEMKHSVDFLKQLRARFAD